MLIILFTQLQRYTLSVKLQKTDERSLAVVQDS